MKPIGTQQAAQESGIRAKVAGLRAEFALLWTDEGIAGRCFRRFLPLALILPPTVGWLGLQLEAMGWLDPVSGIVSRLLVIAFVFAAGAIWTARRLRSFEEELNRLNAELEERVAQRTRELRASNEELESFSYSVAHDLRAPLRAISGFAEAVLKDEGPKLGERARSDLDRVIAAARRMSILIDDLLALSRATRAELRSESVDLSALAASVLQELSPPERIDVVVEPEMRAAGDRILLRSVLQNLLSNAIKFSGPLPRARVEFGRWKGEEGGYFVRDTGVGFDMKHAGGLFTPFQRLHDTRRFPGTGIGLAIVKRIVTRHGGRVWAESAPEQGATFHFSL